MNPRLLLDSGVHDVDSGFRVLDSRKWELDSRSQFLQWGSGFQSPEFQIPHDKISWILDSTSKHLLPLVEKTILKCSLISGKLQCINNWATAACLRLLTTPENTIAYHRVRGARVAQWWEHSPPTNVAPVWILASTSYAVGWVCCWFSPLLQEVFRRVLQFSSLLKNQHFQIPIQSGMYRHVLMNSLVLRG